MSFYLLLSHSVLLGQEPSVIDSLKNEYKKASDFSTSSNHLVELALAYAKVNIDSTLAYSEIIKKVALEQNDSTLLAQGLRVEGIAFTSLGESKKATKALFKSIEIHERKGNLLFAAQTKKNIGNVYILQGNVLWEHYEDSLATVYYNKSKEIYEEVLAEAILLQDSALISSVYYNLGSAANSLYNFEEAIELYDKSLTWHKRVSYAQEYYDVQAIKMAPLVELGRTEEVEKIYNESLDYFKKNDMLKDWLLSNLNMSLNYIDVDPVARIRLLLQADSLAHVMNNINSKIGTSGKIYQFYKDERNFEKALEYLEILSDLSSDVMSAKSTAAMEELNLKYDTEKSEKELLAEKREKEKANSRSLILSIVLLSVIILLILGTLYFTQKQKTQRLKQEQEVDELLQNQEIATLQSNLEGQDEERKRIAKDLHDRLGSRLSAVGMYMEASYDKESVNQLQEKALKELHNAIKETREIAYNLETGILSKFGLGSALEDLKQKLEETQSLDLALAYPEHMPRFGSDQETEVYRIVQEIINNTLKHAQASCLNITIAMKDGCVSLATKDNGVGFDSEVKKMGMGLKNIKSRVHKLAGTVDITSAKNKGTCYNIQFNV